MSTGFVNSRSSNVEPSRLLINAFGELWCNTKHITDKWLLIALLMIDETTSSTLPTPTPSRFLRT